MKVRKHLSGLCRSTHLYWLPVRWLVFYLGILLGRSVASDDTLEYYTLEELGPNKQVGNLIKDFGLDHRYSPMILNTLRFSFLTQPNFDRQCFSIDERTGDIKTAYRVDRDKICPRLDDCVVTFDVAIQPMEYFQIIKVKIEIMDVNDNAPIFPEKRIFHQIPEFAELGTGFVVPAATDLDSGKFGIQRYEVYPNDGKFQLTVRSTADGGTDLRLVVRDKLDRETEERHVLTVFAIDGGEPPKTGSIIVNVTIQDANDNSPEFENNSYEVWVAENSPVGTVILKVKAKDKDSGLNAAIVYEFSKHTAQKYGHLFAIKPESGKIYLKNNLDYEIESIYLLSVTATDKGADSLPAHASVVVRVDDVNDHSPQISVNTLTPNRYAEVKENSEVGTFVAHLSVTDADSGDNGRFLCTVDDQNFALQQIYQSELKIVTATRLDREARESYDLSISCQDFGAQRQTSVVPLKVKVSDENDHSPMFEKAFYETAIKENDEVGITLFHVTATDQDAGQNGFITYKISDDSNKLIRVDRNSGTITSAVSFDFEQLNELVFFLTAEDHGDPPRSADVKLKLIILDMDDSKPAFTQDNYVFVVDENRPPGTEVGQVEAFDRDSVKYTFTYSIAELDNQHSDVLEFFSLNQDTGRMTTRVTLDRERQASHRFLVLASHDGGSSPNTATATATVYVGDENDHNPVFTFPATGNETILVSSQTPRGHSVGRLRATDQDSGANANLSFHFAASSKPNSFFRVVADTGDIIVDDDISEIVRETFVLRFVVRDGGQRTDHATVRLIVDKHFPYVDGSSMDPAYSILASEDMVVVLAFTLATILLAILIIICMICMFRRKNRHGTGNSLENFVGLKNSMDKDLKCAQHQQQQQRLYAPSNGGCPSPADVKICVGNGSAHKTKDFPASLGRGDNSYSGLVNSISPTSSNAYTGNGKVTAVVNAYVALQGDNGNASALQQNPINCYSDKSHSTERETSNNHCDKQQQQPQQQQPGKQAVGQGKLIDDITASPQSSWILDISAGNSQDLSPCRYSPALHSTATRSESVASNDAKLLMQADVVPPHQQQQSPTQQMLVKHQRKSSWNSVPYQVHDNDSRKKPVVVFIRDLHEPTTADEASVQGGGPSGGACPVVPIGGERKRKSGEFNPILTNSTSPASHGMRDGYHHGYRQWPQHPAVAGIKDNTSPHPPPADGIGRFSSYTLNRSTGNSGNEYHGCSNSLTKSQTTSSLQRVYIPTSTNNHSDYGNGNNNNVNKFQRLGGRDSELL